MRPTEELGIVCTENGSEGMWYYPKEDDATREHEMGIKTQKDSDAWLAGR